MTSLPMASLPTHPHHEPDHDDFGGLHPELFGLMSRRRALARLGGIGATGLLAACGGTDGGSSAATTTAATTAPTTDASTPGESTGATVASAPDATDDVESAGAEIPDETAGPYPADGSNGPNFLTEDGIIRRDITSSVGTLSGTADGIAATINLTVVDAATGAPLPGAAVYLWHCTAGGQYSIYEVTDQNYLRGVQTADDGGVVSFDTVFPGCYAGRWPHCHFEVYDGLDAATAGSAAVKTSQLALPQASCDVVYADSRYGDSAGNLGRLSLTTDNVFRDGWDDQLASVTGSNDGGYAVDLLVRV